SERGLVRFDSDELARCRADTRHVQLIGCDEHVDVVGGSHEPVMRHRVAADDQKPNAMSVEDTNKLGEIALAHGRLPPRQLGSPPPPCEPDLLQRVPGGSPWFLPLLPPKSTVGGPAARFAPSFVACHVQRLLKLGFEGVVNPMEPPPVALPGSEPPP